MVFPPGASGGSPESIPGPILLRKPKRVLGPCPNLRSGSKASAERAKAYTFRLMRQQWYVPVYSTSGPVYTRLRLLVVRTTCRPPGRSRLRASSGDMGRRRPSCSSPMRRAPRRRAAIRSGSAAVTAAEKPARRFSRWCRATARREWNSMSCRVAANIPVAASARGGEMMVVISANRSRTAREHPPKGPRSGGADQCHRSCPEPGIADGCEDGSCECTAACSGEVHEEV